jgi:hypothetical protein
VLTKLKAVNATNDDDRARVNYIRFRAYTIKLDDAKACSAMREAMNLVKDPTLRDKYAPRAAGCGIS